MENREFLRCARFYAGPPGGADVKAALLGKEPRYARDRDFETLHIRLDLRVDMKGHRVEGLCATRLRSLVDGLASLSFDAARLRVLSARVHSRPVPFRHKDSTLTLRLGRRLKTGEEADVAIRYRISDPEVGLHFVDPGPGGGRFHQLWSQGQPEDSRFWFPCHDAPHQKATSEIVATVPAGYRAVSNGVLQEARKDPRRRTETYHWRMDRPHALYLLSLAVGRFGEVKERWKHVPLSYYCERGREAQARLGFAKTAKAMDYFSKSLGVPYPYEKYAQVCVGHYPGGMENTTATTMTDLCLIDERAGLDNDVDLLVAHELAHQWFGDLVTCRDWSHAWLNEGFATYLENLFTLHDKGVDEADYELHGNQHAYFQECRDRYRRPIVCKTFSNPWVLFDRHLYEKAGWVLHMLRGILGDAPWWKAVAYYLDRHAHGSVETDDLILALEKTTGRNLRPFFDQWVYKSGHPSFKVRYQWKQASKRAELWVLQTQAVGDAAPLFRLDADVRFSGRGWVRKFTKPVNAKEHRWSFRLPGEPLAAEFDPEHKLLKELDFQKPLALWTYQLLHAPRALSRIHAARAAARWGGDGVVETIRRAMRREPFWGAAAEMAAALACIRTPAAFKALKTFVHVRHPKVRRAVVQGLGEFKTGVSARLLLDLLGKDPSLHVQAEAARALGGLRDRRFYPHLIAKTRERCYRDIVPGGALQGLANAMDPALLPVLRRHSRGPGSCPGRLYAIRALAQFSGISSRVIPWLGGYVADEDERVSMTAIAALGQTGDERALPVLERIRDRTSSCRHRTCAEESIARIRAGAGDTAKKRKMAP